MVNIFPFLVCKTPILSDPYSGDTKEYWIFNFTLAPFPCNSCGKSTCILVSKTEYFALVSVVLPLLVEIILTELIL